MLNYGKLSLAEAFSNNFGCGEPADNVKLMPGLYRIHFINGKNDDETEFNIRKGEDFLNLKKLWETFCKENHLTVNCINSVEYYTLEKEKHMIFSNDVCREYDYIKQNPEEFLPDDEEMTDGIAWNLAYEIVDANLDAEIENLSSIEGTLIAFGKIERWNGFGTAYKELQADNLGEALKEVMEAFSGDNTFDIFVEDEDVIVTQVGHDNPTNPSILVIRAIKKEYENEDVDDLFYEKSESEWRDVTYSLGDKVADIYGWDLYKEVIAS